MAARLLRIACGDTAVFVRVPAGATAADVARAAWEQSGLPAAHELALEADGRVVAPQLPAAALAGAAALRLLLLPEPAAAEAAQGGTARAALWGVMGLFAFALLCAVALPRRRRRLQPGPAGSVPLLPTPPPTPEPEPPCAPPLSAPGPPQLPPPAVAGACADAGEEANATDPTVWAGGGPGRLLCVGRDGSFLGSGSRAVYFVGAPTWWKECVHRRAAPLPAPVVPAAVRRARDRLGGCRRAAGVTQALRAAAPSSPEVVVVTAADKAKGDLPLYARLALAATALWALAHGARAVFYTLGGGCERPGSPSRELHCMQGMWWIHHAWVKPLALLLAKRHFPWARWLLSVDTDAAPRHLGWGPFEVLAAAAQQALPDPPRDRDTAALRLSNLPGEVVVVAAREPVAGVRFNTGVILVRGEHPEAAQLLQHWWASRDDDCAAPSCGKERGWCPSHGRVAGSGDQMGFNYGVWQRYGPKGRMLAVPMVLLNGHSGLMFAHLFSRKSWMTEFVFTEILMRHAAGITALADCPPARGTCADPSIFGHPDGQQRQRDLNCTAAPVVHEWAAAALQHVTEVSMLKEWHADKGRMTVTCLSMLSRRLRAEGMKWSPKSWKKKRRNNMLRQPPPPARLSPRRGRGAPGARTPGAH